MWKFKNFAYEPQVTKKLRKYFVKSICSNAVDFTEICWNLWLSFCYVSFQVNKSYILIFSNSISFWHSNDKYKNILVCWLQSCIEIASYENSVWSYVDFQKMVEIVQHSLSCVHTQFFLKRLTETLFIFPFFASFCFH